MRLTFDTNVILDNLLNRQPFAGFSTRALKFADAGKFTGYVTANTITDLYYLTYKVIRDDQKVRELLRKILNSLKLIDVTGRDIQKALASPMPDFEDALLAACAHRIKSDYILTRNEADFADSPVAALTPEVFLKNET